ncbi:MAG: NAD(P)/FAD-dependent oxidoreductase [Deltaproteobacteria bacterium]|nr:NAD(P)/FAD-dependent oxidoreductase [Deltaproteobacteria bacterium]
MQKNDVIIIGAGGAGMMCAIEAGKRGKEVALLDHAKKIGAKILISGGGRCNFTNTGVHPGAYLSQNPHFCKSALSRFTQDDFISLVKKHGIAFYEKKLGQLFCKKSAQSIIDILVAECREAGAVFHPETKITTVKKQGELFHVETNRGGYTAKSVVVATGGLSIPKVGATGFGYEIAKQFGLEIIPPAPALDGFVFDEKLKKELEGLAGVSLDTIVTCNGVSFRENILFTHVGLSGPAALQASLYWKPGDPVSINLLPDTNALEWIKSKKAKGSRAEIKNLLLEFFPKSFAERFCALYLPSSTPLANMPDKILDSLCKKLAHWEITPKGTVGYGKAEVTRGGVATDELSSKTMESKKVSGLYFIGEVVDVTGWLGGYNFQWAWASGWVAGQYV